MCYGPNVLFFYFWEEISVFYFWNFILRRLLRGRQNIFLTIFSNKFVVKWLNFFWKLVDKYKNYVQIGNFLRREVIILLENFKYFNNHQKFTRDQNFWFARTESLWSWIFSLANAKSWFKINFGHKMFICKPIFKSFAAHISTNLVPNVGEKIFCRPLN